MNISINPTYYCNFRCSFCYLTKQQLADPKRITAEQLDILLSQIDNIEHIDLYGGEVSLFTDDYFYSLYNTIRKYYGGKININTNYSAVRDWMSLPDIGISVSYDFFAREKDELVFKNMSQSKKDLSVLILASKKVLDMGVDYMIQSLNLCKPIKTVEIKPYSINQANADKVTHRDFEQFVIKWLNSGVEKNFEFINEYKIQDSLSKIYNSFSDDHVYVTPNGKFAVLEFDQNDREYFLELDNISEYYQWANKEKQALPLECLSCEFLGNCLTEHYRHVVTDQGCCGYKGLLEWYQNGR